MSSGPHHYRRAEYFASKADATTNIPLGAMYATLMSAHAQMALVAMLFDTSFDPTNEKEWAEVITDKEAST
jgi:hypothetical protein